MKSTISNKNEKVMTLGVNQSNCLPRNASKINGLLLRKQNHQFFIIMRG